MLALVTAVPRTALSISRATARYIAQARSSTISRRPPKTSQRGLTAPASSRLCDKSSSGFEVAAEVTKRERCYGDAVSTDRWLYPADPLGSRCSSPFAAPKFWPRGTSLVPCRALVTGPTLVEVKMRAAYYEAFGGPENAQIGERPDPVPDADHLLVRVHAAGAGMWDVGILNGAVGQALPSIPGCEVAGSVN